MQHIATTKRIIKDKASDVSPRCICGKYWQQEPRWDWAKKEWVELQMRLAEGGRVAISQDFQGDNQIVIVWLPRYRFDFTELIKKKESYCEWHFEIINYNFCFWLLFQFLNTWIRVLVNIGDCCTHSFGHISQSCKCNSYWVFISETNYAKLNVTLAQ